MVLELLPLAWMPHPALLGWVSVLSPILMIIITGMMYKASKRSATAAAASSEAGKRAAAAAESSSKAAESANDLAARMRSDSYHVAVINAKVAMCMPLLAAVTRVETALSNVTRYFMNPNEVSFNDYERLIPDLMSSKQELLSLVNRLNAFAAVDKPSAAQTSTDTLLAIIDYCNIRLHQERQPDRPLATEVELMQLYIDLCEPKHYLKGLIRRIKEEESIHDYILAVSQAPIQSLYHSIEIEAITINESLLAIIQERLNVEFTKSETNVEDSS